MSDLLARKTIFTSGNLIRASEWIDELTQLYQFLTGVLAGRVIININFGVEVSGDSLNGIPLVLRNKAAFTPQGNFVEFKQLNVTKLKVTSGKQITSLVTTVAPIDVQSTTLVTNLNANYLDGIALAGFFLTGRTVDFAITFYFDGIPTTGTEVFRFITPAGTSMSIRQFDVSSTVRAGNPSNDGVAVVEVRKGGVAVSTLTIEQANGWISTQSFNTALAENDVVSCHINSIAGTNKPYNISAKVKFRQTLVS